MLIRVRSNVGVWRVEVDDSATLQGVLDQIAQTRPHVQYEKPLSADPAGHQLLDPSQLLSTLGLRHGSMVYCRVDPATCADNSAVVAAEVPEPEKEKEGQYMRRIIDKDGSIKMVPSNEVRAPGQDKGFRKGMLPLRDMKMQWTCTCVKCFLEESVLKSRRE